MKVAISNSLSERFTTSTHGGIMISASGSFIQTTDGSVCIETDMHACPVEGHGVTDLYPETCSSKVKTNGYRVALAGNPDTGSVAKCGAVLLEDISASGLEFL